jgi:hypothetical protein
MTSWEDRAACLDAPDPEVFFPVQLGGRPARGKPHPMIRQALVYCDVCPVRRECLWEGISNMENWGVWGGHYLPEKRKRNWRPTAYLREGA